jgi:hypothetical protein
MTVAALGANLLTLFALLLAVDLLSFAPEHHASITRWLLRAPDGSTTGASADSTVDAPTAG